MPRVVVDCMIYLSPIILVEVHDVLTRPKTAKKFPSLTPEAVELFLKDVQSRAVIRDRVPHVFGLPRDPKDERYLDLAIATGARYLVSRDQDLLDLMSDDAFRQAFPDLVILDPVDFLRTLAEEKPDSSRSGDGTQGTT